MTTYPYFREVQKFRQWWLWILVIISSAPIWYITIIQLFFNKHLGKEQMPTVLLIVFFILIGILLPLFIFKVKLITEVREDGIYVRFFPFHFSFQRIPFEDLKDFHIRTYRPIVEYGGWGVRYGASGKAYNVSGNQGLQLEFKNGKRLLIGTQSPEQLISVVRSVAYRWIEK